MPGFRYVKDRGHVEEIGAAGAIAFARMLQGVRQNEVKELIARLTKLKRNLGGADDA